MTPEERLGFLVMEALTHLLASNSQNAAVFRESGGAKCAVALVPHLECRHQALGEWVICSRDFPCGLYIWSNFVQDIKWYYRGCEVRMVFILGLLIPSFVFLVILLFVSIWYVCIGSVYYFGSCIIVIFWLAGVMQQLILASGSDDDMGSLLGLLHSAAPTELQLKTDILKVDILHLFSDYNNSWQSCVLYIVSHLIRLSYFLSRF